MHKKIIIWSLAAGLFFGSIPSLSAQTESDVYVDLSALDALGGTGRSAVNAGPLFPVIKAQKPAAAKTAKKRRVKKAKPASQAKVAVPAKEKVKVDIELPQPQDAKPQTAEAPEPAVAAPVVPVVAEVVSTGVINPQPQLPKIPFVESSEPVKVVDVEPAPHDPKTPVNTGAHVAPVAPDVTEAPVARAAQDAPAAEDATPAQDAPAAVGETPEKPAISTQNVNPRLSFAPDTAELTAQQQQQIDTLVATFEDPAANKIAIYSYNLDDGVDAFRKKRTSLNRAVEVRSYLIRQGYKNFSIKVVNVEPGSEKINSVEIEELK